MMAVVASPSAFKKLASVQPAPAKLCRYAFSAILMLARVKGRFSWS